MWLVRWGTWSRDPRVRCWPGDWNEMTVTAKGKNVTVEVNGVKTAELKDDPGRLSGFIAFQIHGGQDIDVQLKDIEIDGQPVTK